MTIANEIFEQLRAQGGEEKARHLSRFFKCKPGGSMAKAIAFWG